MPDDRIYDAINLFKFSPTRLGTHNIGGDATYKTRYRSLANDVVEKLWSLWRTDQIGFAVMDNLGDFQAGTAALDIRINSRLEPNNDPTSYQNAQNQGRLAATSCVLAHEGTHAARPIMSKLEQEVLCRTIQFFYFMDLMSPRSYHSLFAGARCTAQYLPSTPFFDEYNKHRRNRIMNGELIDSVLTFPPYRENLESDATAEFIKRSLTWWNGLSNRWPSTRGYYLRCLASRAGQDYAEEILIILESLTRHQWVIAKTVAGNIQRIRSGLESGSHIYNIPFTSRISQVQETLGEYFAIRTS